MCEQLRDYFAVREKFLKLHEKALHWLQEQTVMVMYSAHATTHAHRSKKNTFSRRCKYPDQLYLNGYLGLRGSECYLVIIMPSSLNTKPTQDCVDAK